MALAALARRSSPSGRFAVARPAARSARASRNLRTAIQFEVRWPRGKKLRGDEGKAQHALPQERKRAKQNKEMEVRAMAINKVIGATRGRLNECSRKEVWRKNPVFHHR